MTGRICRIAASNIREYSSSSRRLSTSFFKDGAQEHWRHLLNSHNGAEVYLIGTCHASSASANAVKEMIRAIKPSTVALELCEGRARSLLSGNQAKTFSPKDFLNLPESFGQKISAFKPLQELLKIFGINYGEEFKVAMEESGKIGAELLYIDREMDVTFREVNKSLSFLEITKFVVNLPHHASRFPNFFESRSICSIEDFMRDKKLEQQVFQFLEEQFPGAMKAILHDRNEYMIKQLKEKKGKIVAVVGLAHVDGMEKLWNNSGS